MNKSLFLLFFVFSTTTSFAQKSSPVVGDAATLIDLLNKDYNSVNPDTWDEEINTDRGKVIAIFKSYLEDSKKTPDSITTTTNLNEAYVAYTKAKEELNAISKINININISTVATTSTATQIAGSDAQFTNIRLQLATLQETFRNKKKAYFTQKSTYDNKEFDSLEKLFSGNDYLKQMIKVFKKKYTAVSNDAIDSYAEINTYSSIQKSIPFIGGDLSFETIIDGLSRFLAKRIKEEMTIHAIDKIKTYLENPTPENYCYELLTLLPSTTNYLKSFESNQLLNFTDEMKQYIEQDLNNLLENAVNLKETPRLKKYIEKYPDLDFAFEGLEVIPQLSKIKNPVDYFEMMENSRNLARWRTSPITNPEDKSRYNISQGFRLASMMAYSMTVVDNGETKFASVDMISNYGNEINFFYLYFGFLHQQNLKYYKINFLPVTSATPVELDISRIMVNPLFKYGSIETVTNLAQFLKSNLTSISANAEKIHSQALALKKKNKNNEEIKYEEVYGFINDFISFAEEVVTTSDLLFDNTYQFYSTNLRNDFNLKGKLAPYFNVSRIANDMMLDLHQKKYSNAIIKAIEIPYNFRKNNDNFIGNLVNYSNQLKANDDLSFLKEVFDQKAFKGLSEEKKIVKLRKIRTKLDILSIRMGGDASLSTVVTKCDAFINYVKNFNSTAVARSSIDQLQTQIDILKSEMVAHNVSIMNFEGITRVKVNEYVVNLLVSNGYSSADAGGISTRIYNYLVELFSSHVLNISTNGPDDEENIRAIIAAFAPQSLYENNKITDNNAIKVIHFVNEMAGAKDAEEVEKAITAFALPVGSSSLKEKAKSYFSINAYPGLIAGFEYSKGQDRAETFGFTAPVGLYGQFFSWGDGNSLGAFIPIIDIGAPVRLRMDSENDTKTLPDFNFNDIFSPGFYLSYGFGKKLPLAINFGAQYGPKLRDIDVGNDGKFDSIDSYRVSVALVIDLPLFTISGKY